MDEKVINSKLVFQGTFLRVIRDRVVTPRGIETNREYIQHPGAALIIPLLDNGQVIMEKQYRHAVKQVFLEFPAGKLDPQESSLASAKRELKEETGYEAKDWKFLTSIHPVIGYSDEKIDIYLARELTKGDAQLDENEDLEVIEVHVEELMKKVKNGEVTDVKTQIAAFWLEKVLKGEWAP